MSDMSEAPFVLHLDVESHVAQDNYISGHYTLKYPVIEPKSPINRPLAFSINILLPSIPTMALVDSTQHLKYSLLDPKPKHIHVSNANKIVNVCIYIYTHTYIYIYICVYMCIYVHGWRYIPPCIS